MDPASPRPNLHLADYETGRKGGGWRWIARVANAFSMDEVTEVSPAQKFLEVELAHKY